MLGLASFGALLGFSNAQTSLSTTYTGVVTVSAIRAHWYSYNKSNTEYYYYFTSDSSSKDVVPTECSFEEFRPRSGDQNINDVLKIAYLTGTSVSIQLKVLAKGGCDITEVTLQQ